MRDQSQLHDALVASDRATLAAENRTRGKALTTTTLLWVKYIDTGVPRFRCTISAQMFSSSSTTALALDC